MRFSDLPESVQKEIKTILCCFQKCYVERRDGAYSVLPAVCLQSSNYPEWVGEYKDTDILTRNEWVTGFTREFGFAPIFGYKKKLEQFKTAQ